MQGGLSHPYRGLMLKILTRAFLLSVVSVTSIAHGLVHEQINKITAQWDQNPDCDLLVKRGRLWLEDQNLKKAEEDFKRAIECDGGNRNALFHLSEQYLLEKNFPLAMKFNRMFLKGLNNEAGALKRGFELRGQILLAQDKPSQAAQAFRAALLHANPVEPALIMEYVQALKSPEAIKELDKWNQKIGPLLVLEQAALEYEEQLKHWSSALKRTERIISQNPNNLRYQVKKINQLIALKSFEDAQLQLNVARKAWASLPKTRQASKAVDQQRRLLDSYQLILSEMTTKP